jgi:hypothetical protein
VASIGALAQWHNFGIVLDTPQVDDLDIAFILGRCKKWWIETSLFEQGIFTDFRPHVFCF